MVLFQRIRNPLFFVLISIFIALNIVDGITATFILPGESNPIFILTGSIYPLLVIKAGLIAMLVIVYRTTATKPMSEFVYYTYMLVLCMGIFLLIFGVYTNFKGINNPDLLEEAASVPATEKIRVYTTTITFLYLLPTALSLLAFKFYEWSRKNVLLKNGRKRTKEIQMGNN